MDIKLFPEDEALLRTKSQSIKTVDGSIYEFVQKMFQCMYEAKGVGLAAVQVGTLKRIFVMDVSEDKSQPLCLINPEIVERHGFIDWEEGCLSIPDVTAPTERSEFILIKAVDEQGKSVEYELDQLGAVCAQHELDHLNGTLFIDQLSRLKYGRLKRKLLKQQKQN